MILPCVLTGVCLSCQTWYIIGGDCDYTWYINGGDCDSTWYINGVDCDSTWYINGSISLLFDLVH